MPLTISALHVLKAVGLFALLNPLTEHYQARTNHFYLYCARPNSQCCVDSYSMKALFIIYSLSIILWICKANGWCIRQKINWNRV